ncbi:MAG: hypothetical protein H0X69_00755 [Gemmatimonadales bacterium]|nr:hypothetical protein [Gemmatimonadales bacterium]
MAADLDGGWRLAGLWAEADLEHAARVDPQSAEVIGDLGAIYTRLRRYREARAALERARVLRPSSLSLAHARARLAAMEGDLEGIRQVFRSMEEIVGRRRVVAYVALREDLIWALDDEARRAVLELTPASTFSPAGPRRRSTASWRWPTSRASDRDRSSGSMPV